MTPSIFGAMLCAVTVGTAAAVALAPGAVAAPAFPASAAATVMVVSNRGSDQAVGSAARPLRTIRAALHRLGPAGGTVELRGGSYAERVTLHAVTGVTLRPYRHEHAVLDGQSLQPPHGLTAMVEISDSDNITVQGLDITGYHSTRLGTVPAGIYVHGHDRGINILGNHVHNLGNANLTLGSSDINAHGIAVYGDDPHRPVSGLVIGANEVDDLQLGASETVVVNGNVAAWAIVTNHIHDVNNIGIDAIGFESTLTGRYRYTNTNRARDGLIADNDVSRVRSKGNPAYWDGDQWCNCADGIYVDGGTHIVIRNNHVTANDIGVEVAAEDARGSADHILVQHNVITGSLFTGLATGGYCNGAQGCGGVQTGTAQDNTFQDNWLRGNNQLDDGSPELLIQYHADRDVFCDNTIIATNSSHTIYGTVASSDSGNIAANHSDHNIFAAEHSSPDSLQFGWNGRTWVGAHRYINATGQDRGSQFLDSR